jgi:hypothetical protein
MQDHARYATYNYRRRPDEIRSHTEEIFEQLFPSAVSNKKLSRRMARNSRKGRGGVAYIGVMTGVRRAQRLLRKT